MPQLGETVTEGTIIRWLKQVGDEVSHDEPLFEVSTEKVDSEVPSSAEGYLTEILVEEGATVDVGTRLAVIGEAASGGVAADAAAEADATTGGEAGSAEPAAPTGGETPAGAATASATGATGATAGQAGADGGGSAAGEAVPAVSENVVPADDLAEPADPGDESTSGVGADGGDGDGGTVRSAGGASAAAPSARTEEGPAGSQAAPAPAGTGAPTPEPGSAPPNAQPVGAAPAAGGDGAGVSGAALLSPVVRRLLNEHGLDPSAIRGTGQGGRITRGDVLSYIDSQATRGDGGRAEASAAVSERAAGAPAPPAAPRSPAPAPSPDQSAAAARAFPPAAAGEGDEIIPFSNIRRLTADHMVRSKATSAHTLVAIEADYEGVDNVRRRNKERFKKEEGISLTYLPFVARAVVDVLRDYPQLNASVGEDALLVHRDVNLGVAVDLDRQGLIVPVVRQADGQSLRGLARAIADLAERARSRRLSADDVVGGTFTITNPGPFGTFLTAPIISQPQVAILSTDGVKRRPVVVSTPGGSEAIAIHSVGMLALSFDHRAVDGAYASAFIHDLAREIETRDWSTEL
jgi:pyruvate dehydrogenase E2 component (dihydrolipoamide acetyltransferase)